MSVGVPSTLIATTSKIKLLSNKIVQLFFLDSQKEAAMRPFLHRDNYRLRKINEYIRHAFLELPNFQGIRRKSIDDQ
jgi:hypothetical protein